MQLQLTILLLKITNDLMKMMDLFGDLIFKALIFDVVGDDSASAILVMSDVMHMVHTA